jgi:hypothetical protein
MRCVHADGAPCDPAPRTDRHDEEWEQEIDRKTEAIRDQHRFRSFAPERDGNIVKWWVPVELAFIMRVPAKLTQCPFR